MPRSQAAVRQFVHDNSPQLSGTFSSLMLRFVKAGQDTVGDLETLLVLLIITQRTNAHPDYRLLAQKDLAEGRIDPLPALPLNLQGLAQSAGIPRETVRRKVEELLRRGWVVKEGKMLRLTPKGYQDLKPLRDTAVLMTADLSTEVNRLLVKSGR